MPCLPVPALPIALAVPSGCCGFSTGIIKKFGAVHLANPTLAAYHITEDLIINNIITVPSLRYSVSMAFHLAGDSTPMSGGTYLSGTIYRDGGPASSPADPLIMTHRNSSGTVIHIYFLNHSTTFLVLVGYRRSDLTLACSPGDTFTFTTVNVDGITAASDFDNSRSGYTFEPLVGMLPNTWESGMVIDGFWQ